MSFTAKVKSTGKLFQATSEWEPGGVVGRDTHRLAEGMSYAGHLFDGTQLNDSPELVEFAFTKADWGIFTAEELEELFVDRIRLYRST